MTDAPEAAVVVPDARVRQRRWRVSAAWLVPLMAAIVAGFLVYDHRRHAGPTITIAFTDGAGVKVGQTEIRYRGVPIGEVRGIDLSPDLSHVVVTAQLRHSAAAVAREGSVFWIVRPQVGPVSISGLSTVLTGPYIEVLPGRGQTQTSFSGVDHPSPTLNRRGLTFVLATANMGSVRTGSPIYYRGIEVGTVVGAHLNRDATSAHVDVFIDQPHTRLVRIGSRFWSVSGLDIHVGLFKGLDISLESLRSLAVGGVAFATPDVGGAPAKAGTTFVLHEQAEKAWLTWSPKIALPAND